MIGGEEIMTSGFENSCPEIRGDSWCTLESWLTLLCLYAGKIFYGVVISEFSVIVLSMDRAGRMYSEKVEEVNEYMRSKQLSPMLREQVREYYTIAFQDRKLFDEASIMKELSPALRMRILEENRKDLFNRVPFLRSVDKERKDFSAMLSTQLSPLCCLEKESIFEEGTTGHEMFFVYSGLVELLSTFAPSDTPVVEAGVGGLLTVIGPGSFFGEVACFLTQRRTAGARAKTVAILYVITSEDLADCLEDFPNTEAHLRRVAGTRLNRIEDMKTMDKAGETKNAVDMVVVDAEDALTSMFCAEADEEDEIKKERNEQRARHPSLDRSHAKVQKMGKGAGGAAAKVGGRLARLGRHVSNRVLTRMPSKRRSLSAEPRVQRGEMKDV